MEPAHRPAWWSVGGVLLVVDDDPLMRTVARRTLEARGRMSLERAVAG